MSNMPSEANQYIMQSDNDNDNAQDQEQAQFPLFSLLPIEIRLLIWECVLQRRRYINIGVVSLEIEPDWNEKGLYQIAICGYQVLNKLLRVNRESRRAALRYYRVQIPCIFTPTNDLNRIYPATPYPPGTLYLNPEHDIIQICSRMTRGSMFDFLHKLKTIYDPLQVGIRNLAIDFDTLNAGDFWSVQPSKLDPPVRSTLVELFSHLYELYFVSQQTVGRQIFGFHSYGIQTGVIFNRSFPIMPTSPGIEYWDRDPRPIAEDLKRVLVGGPSDPRRMIQLWQGVLHKFGISPPKINYQFLLACVPGNLQHPGITDRESSEVWLQREEQMLTDPFFATMPREHGFGPTKTVETASFGFWVFPLEAVGPYPKFGSPIDEEWPYESNRILDLTKYWPTLARMRVPEGRRE